MTRPVKVYKGKYRSGHCGLTNPPEIHRQCAGEYYGHVCRCICHEVPEVWVDTPDDAPSYQDVYHSEAVELNLVEVSAPHCPTCRCGETP